jgi:hypothetical protein
MWSARPRAANEPDIELTDASCALRSGLLQDDSRQNCDFALNYE